MRICSGMTARDTLLANVATSGCGSPGVSERTLAMEREGWILVEVLYPDLIDAWIRSQSAMFDDPGFREPYLLTDQALDWPPDDPLAHLTLEVGRTTYENLSADTDVVVWQAPAPASPVHRAPAFTPSARPLGRALGDNGGARFSRGGARWAWGAVVGGGGRGLGGREAGGVAQPAGVGGSAAAACGGLATGTIRIARTEIAPTTSSACRMPKWSPSRPSNGGPARKAP